MNLKSTFKRMLSGVLSLAVTASIMPCFPAFADEQTEPEKYPYMMFAASDSDGAITINANNFCVNGNIATNGTIVSSGNMNVNGTRTENADEEMIHILKKLNYSYFSGDNVEVYVEDYSFEDLNININNPMDIYGSLELTGNINLNSGIKAYEDVTINGEVKNANEAVICSETGDIIIETTNVNFNGLIYAPYGDIIIDTDNLNLNNVVIIGQTITLDCPNVNANYSRNTAELVGTESDIDVELYAFGEYNSEANSIDIEWYTNYANSSYEIWISDDNADYTSVGVVSDGTKYQYPITEDFEKRYFKISLVTNYGEYIESIPFIATKTESGYSVDFLDSDEDGLPDIYEVIIGTDINKIDSDDDELTDYQEVYITGTDPTVYDSVTEGVSDADADSDEDGLSNIYEIEIGTSPLKTDTDDDGLSDYDEIYIYGTDPLNPDTDGDGLEDGDELHIGIDSHSCLDPTNPETFGIPDAEYKVEQTISADSGVLSEINTAENAYELSIDMKTNGYAEKEVIVSKSGYSYAIENDAMIGLSADIFISDTCNPEEIVLKYNIKEAYIDNTLNLYSSLEEFQGIKRLNIFKFHEDKNMLLPVETEFDVENGLLYAEVDELGTYCIMDMEIWLNNLGVEMPEEIQHEENAMYFNSPSILSASADSGSVWTSEITNAPLDIVFLLQAEGDSSSVFESDKLLISTYSRYLFDTYDDVRITIIKFGNGNSNIMCNKSGSMYLTSFSDVMSVMEQITYTRTDAYCVTNPSFEHLFNDVQFRSDSDRFVYKFINGRTRSTHGYDAIGVYSRKIGSYSEIFYSNWHYIEQDYHHEIQNAIAANNDLFICLDDDTLSEFKKHLKSKINFTRPVYSILLPTKWKKISLDGELSPSNGIDTDKDTLTDWEEVNVDELIKLSDGNYTLPHVSVNELVNILNRFDSKEYLFITERTLPVYYLPILSDPTKIDTDGDKIPDSYHSDMYMEDDWYAFSDPNPCVSDITEISLKNDFFSIDYEYKGDTPENEYVNWILKNNNKAASYGGYQGWFGDYGYLNDYKVFCNQTVSGAEMHSHGCGIIAVADMFFYLLKGHGNSFSPKWDKLMYLGDGYTHLSFDMYTIYMIWISDAFYYHPIIKGTVSEYLDGNLVQAINMINAVSDLGLKAKWCASTNSDTCLRRIKDMINNDIPVVYSCRVPKSRQLQLYCFHNDYEKAFNDIEYTRSDGSVKHATAVYDHYMVATGVLEFSDDVANIIGRKIMLKTATYGKKYYVDFEEYCDRLSLIDTNIMYVEWED